MHGLRLRIENPRNIKKWSILWVQYGPIVPTFWTTRSSIDGAFSRSSADLLSPDLCQTLVVAPRDVARMFFFGLLYYFKLCDLMIVCGYSILLHYHVKFTYHIYTYIYTPNISSYIIYTESSNAWWSVGNLPRNWLSRRDATSSTVECLGSSWIQQCPGKTVATCCHQSEKNIWKLPHENRWKSWHVWMIWIISEWSGNIFGNRTWKGHAENDL